ncbi:heat shock 70 kDa protein 12A-like [Centruroides sculpturatus]|uniref:heat shock 70 kDa protein 12A-like n=1 Tax=Centruroides sculpturatus TaxID=218467 RepID=UPI000C6DED49|nr:heat shock 70 kDa protein 12A-like [Centruroides sculpturatus]XP_023224234.1 heat shock 70 kDa protein 12A-like [Centruroides sculpturatus]
MLSETETQTSIEFLRKTDSEPTQALKSPPLVKEMMKKMASYPSGSSTIENESYNQSSKNIKKQIPVTSENVNRNQRFLWYNQKQFSQSPPKPPRYLQAGKAGKETRDLGIQNDNLIEEVQEDKSDHNSSILDGAVVAGIGNGSVDSGTSSPHQSYLVVVAIDFGTTYSGYAFSFTHDPDNIHMMRKWEGGDPGIITQKTPTILLMTSEGDFHSFGYTARDFYHDMDPQEARKWLYFEKFKMTLHNIENLSRETRITATNGKSMSALTIFAHALRYFKEHALQELSDQAATRLLDDDIRWVVTVPAIWRQPAKQFMRAAAYQAGIASPDFPEQLLIALEPEAASIYCRKLRVYQLVPNEPSPQKLIQKPNNGAMDPVVTETNGIRYSVVDCGGGTVDITVHELLDQQGTLKELHKATGGPFGSVGIDKEFLTLLDNIFGEEIMLQYRTKRPAGFVDLMIAFEARKRNASPYKNNPLNISLPFSFIDFYKKTKGYSVEAAIRKFNDPNIKWSSQGMLRLSQEAMLRLFEPTINAIKDQITKVLERIPKIAYLFLVGGFAESQVLQYAIRGAFSHKLKVVIPQGVSLAILRGAVLFGLDPGIVNIRRSRMTYGVGVLNRFVHGYHLPEKMIVKDGVEWCTDVFDRFVVADQSVAQGDVVVRSYAPARSSQSKSVIHIFSSSSHNVRYVTDEGVKKCGTLVLDLPRSTAEIRGAKREILTRMMFGETEIKVTALDVATGKCVRAEIDFLS